MPWKLLKAVKCDLLINTVHLSEACDKESLMGMTLEED
jgi:hypothetical protein